MGALLGRGGRGLSYAPCRSAARPAAAAWAAKPTFFVLMEVPRHRAGATERARVRRTRAWRANSIIQRALQLARARQAGAQGAVAPTVHANSPEALLLASSVETITPSMAKDGVASFLERWKGRVCNGGDASDMEDEEDVSDDEAALPSPVAHEFSPSALWSGMEAVDEAVLNGVATEEVARDIFEALKVRRDPSGLTGLVLCRLIAKLGVVEFPNLIHVLLSSTPNRVACLLSISQLPPAFIVNLRREGDGMEDIDEFLQAWLEAPAPPSVTFFVREVVTVIMMNLFEGTPDKSTVPLMLHLTTEALFKDPLRLGANPKCADMVSLAFACFTLAPDLCNTLAITSGGVTRMLSNPAADLNVKQQFAMRLCLLPSTPLRLSLLSAISNVIGAAKTTTLRTASGSHGLIAVEEGCSVSTPDHLREALARLAL